MLGILNTTLKHLFIITNEKIRSEKVKLLT